jgi:hypothetical protein
MSTDGARTQPVRLQLIGTTNTARLRAVFMVFFHLMIAAW